MNPFKALPHQPLTLVKRDGQRIQNEGVWGADSVQVFDRTFPVEVGDTIERQLPSGIVEQFEVVHTGYQGGVAGVIPDHYSIKLRSRSARPVPPTSVVHNYHNTGQVAAMGPHAQAIGNTMIGQATQQVWNDLDRGRVAEELAKLRAELASSIATGDDPDDAIELGNVGHATKALASGDKDGFFGALKKFGAKTWALAERLGLEWLQFEARDKLGLPPPGAT
jgi:hypothetical protein